MGLVSVTREVNENHVPKRMLSSEILNYDCRAVDACSKG